MTLNPSPPHRYEKAMELCISSGNFDDAMDLAEQYKITLTESMAEGMTMEKKLRGDKDYKAHNTKRRTILTRMAALAQLQGEFNIATKKYAEAGNSKEAMVSLLQSGDTKRIITFAGYASDQSCATSQSHPTNYIPACSRIQPIMCHLLTSNQSSCVSAKTIGGYDRGLG